MRVLHLKRLTNPHTFEPSVRVLLEIPIELQTEEAAQMTQEEQYAELGRKLSAAITYFEGKRVIDELFDDSE